MKCLKPGWCLTSGAILAYVLTFQDGPHFRERDILLIYCMLALSFPLGLVGTIFPVALTALMERLGLNVSIHPLRDTLLTWLLLFGLGYLQWFVLVPRVVKRLRAAKH